MSETPASIEHDGEGKDSAERVRRLQRGSWPRGQGEENQEVQEVKEVEEVKEEGARFRLRIEQFEEGPV
jgi:RNA 3'-terminal phosphate cyclase